MAPSNTFGTTTYGEFDDVACESLTFITAALAPEECRKHGGRPEKTSHNEHPNSAINYCRSLIIAVRLAILQRFEQVLSIVDGICSAISFVFSRL
jgi:hypothetical protein